MSKTTKTNWTNYYKHHENRPPRSLLVQALTHVPHRNKAIDIGGGALSEAKHLLAQGFEVTVIDKSPLMEKKARDLHNKKLQPFTTSFEDFEFPTNEYDIVCAMFSLPFINPTHFDTVFTNIKKSLKAGGIFCGQLFGDRDGWSTRPNKTFHTEAQARKLFEDMEIISFEEIEEDGKTADGEAKHWHVFHVIAKK